MMVVVFLLTFGFVSLYSSLSLIFMNVFLYAYGYYVVAYTSDKGFKEIRYVYSTQSTFSSSLPIS